MPLRSIDAAHIFIGLKSPLMSHVMLHGARSTIYIDDVLSLFDSFELGVLQDKFLQEFILKGVGVQTLKIFGPPFSKSQISGSHLDSQTMKFVFPMTSLKTY